VGWVCRRAGAGGLVGTMRAMTQVFGQSGRERAERGEARLAMLAEMMATLSRATRPREALDIFFDTMRKLWGVRTYIGLSTAGLDAGHYRVVRHMTDDGRELVAALDFGEAELRLPVRAGGFLGRVCQSSSPQLFAALDEAADPVLGDALAGMCCGMAVPMYEDGEVTRWAILLEREPDAFDADDLEQFLLRANLITVTLRNIHAAAEVRAAHERTQKEIDQIARIQRALLPAELPTIPGLRLAASYAAYDRAGGDLYAFHEGLREPDADESAPVPGWAILIGDVSGHGPAAAVVMAMLHSILHAFPGRPTGPADVLSFANRHLCAKQIDDAFVTAFLAFYDPNTRRMSYAAAGHPPPLWRKPQPDGGVIIDTLDGGRSLPLGIAADAAYTEAAITLAPGQTLALYTDGIPETRCPTGEFFGTDGLTAALRACSGGARCLVDTLDRTLRAHESGARPTDDQTLVAIEVV
jgi:sigma-B regulation protein RsbU (phosphoserine phosphatase)